MKQPTFSDADHANRRSAAKGTDHPYMIDPKGIAPTISVVIPVYNEEKLLPKCLEALSAQTHRPLEIIVVDNNSTDNSVAIALTFPLVRVVKEPNQGISYARTRGFDEARGQIIVRTDADTIVSPGFLSAYYEAFLNDSIAGACGCDGIAEISTKNLFLGSRLLTIVKNINARYIGAGPIMYGSNCALRKSTWELIRPILTLDDNKISEDIDVTLAILSNNLRIQSVPHAKAKVFIIRSIKLSKIKKNTRVDRLTFEKYKLDRKNHQQVLPVKGNAD